MQQPADAKRLIGVVPQTNTLDRALTVWENLYFHGRFFGMDGRTARASAAPALQLPSSPACWWPAWWPRPPSSRASRRALAPIRWLQVGTLANPLVHLSEGFRAALTDVPHLSLLAVYPVLAGFTLLFSYVGIRAFTRRVIA